MSSAGADVSQGTGLAVAAGGRIFSYLLRYGSGAVAPDACDFLAGNPTGLPIPGYIEALQAAVVPDSPAYFRYGPPWQPAVDAAAAALGARLKLDLDPEDVFLTRGAASGLVVLLRVLLDPGDEVVMMSPPWFFYESLVLQEGGVPVVVPLTDDRFDLDLEAIERALTPKTRVVLINTPHNPSGRIYPADDLAGLGEILEAASARSGRRVYLMSDEAYARILFDGNEMVTPAHHYPATFMLHTYSKTILAPMQRAGYLALAPGMPAAGTLRQAVLWASLTSSAPPDTGMQHAIPRLKELIIDLAPLRARRDRLVTALRDNGYRLGVPQAGFYLFVRTPIPDAVAFCDWLAERKVFTLPGEAFDRPGYFRLSLTATDDMVDRVLPVLAEAQRHFAPNGAASRS
ncbi:MAG: aminotransferase class I/II-fold pyridoxal phosphate-dependent enzyme [Actinomycetota bacterium]